MNVEYFVFGYVNGYQGTVIKLAHCALHIPGGLYVTSGFWLPVKLKVNYYQIQMCVTFLECVNIDCDIAQAVLFSGDWMQL